MTYIVRPAIAPVYSLFSLSLIFAGSSQLLVGPASSLVRAQMKVRSSTRATSAGLDLTRMLFGRLSSASGIAVPDRTMTRSMARYSSEEPSHQCTRSGLQSCAHSSTHCASCLCLFALRVSTSKVRLDIRTTPQSANYGLNTGLKNGERGENGMINRGQPVGTRQ